MSALNSFISASILHEILIRKDCISPILAIQVLALGKEIRATFKRRSNLLQLGLNSTRNPY